MSGTHIKEALASLRREVAYNIGEKCSVKPCRTCDKNVRAREAVLAAIDVASARGVSSNDSSQVPAFYRALAAFANSE